MDNDKINEIVNAYGKVLEKYAGYMVINEKHLSHSKKDIKKAILLSIDACIQHNQDHEILSTGYMQLGMFQKYQDVETSEISNHMKMVEKANEESELLLANVREWEKNRRKEI